MGIAQAIKESGGGPRVAKFEDVGDVVRGKILKSELVQARDDDNKPAFWDDGNKKMQVVVHLQTTLDEGEDDDGRPDDGKRRVFIKWWGKQKQALLTAIEKNAEGFEGADLEPDLYEGADFAAKWVGEGERIKKSWKPEKLMAYKVGLPPARPAGLSKDDDDFGDEEEEAPAPPPKAPARRGRQSSGSSAKTAAQAKEALAAAGLDDADDF